MGNANNNVAVRAPVIDRRAAINSATAPGNASNALKPGRWVNPAYTNGRGSAARYGAAAPVASTPPQANSTNAKPHSASCAGAGHRDHGRSNAPAPKSAATTPIWSNRGPAWVAGTNLCTTSMSTPPAR
jgi:hypothetical protein